jgi:hypothetical protein
MSLVKLTEGTYNIQGKPRDCAGTVFELVEGVKEDKQGLFITVDGRGVRGFPERNIKIRVSDAACYVPHDGTIAMQLETAKKNETDDEIKARMRQRFKVLSDMTQAAKEGNVKAVIVSGPPGVGKSYGVQQQLAKSDLFQIIADRPPKYEVVKGAMSSIGLYMKLYEFREKGNVIVFDDCDSILFDDLSLNILKAALDSSKKRHISWNTESRVLDQMGIPNKFEFQAAAMFISNIKFDNIKSKRLQDHLEALESRCHYIDLTIDTEREKVLRIKQIVEDGMLREYDFADGTTEELLEFIDTNKKRLRELSLRMVLKLADLKKSFGDTWQEYAEVTCMRG